MKMIYIQLLLNYIIFYFTISKCKIIIIKGFFNYSNESNLVTIVSGYAILPLATCLQCVNKIDCLQNSSSSSLIGQFKCTCLPNFTGALCEKPICLDYCYNNGKCSVNNQNKPKCLCINDRFYGERCEFDKCNENDNRNDKCASNCYLDSNCMCRCGEECKEIYCNKSNGSCIELNGQLGCR